LLGGGTISCNLSQVDFFSSELDLNKTNYDPNKDYASEYTIPKLSYETRVMSCGDGSNGALGHHKEGYLTDCFSPEIVEGLPPNVMKVASGHYHSLAVTEDGEVWAWGRNSEGQLGPRDKNSRFESL
jgi:alpha-tubulin suppressor-like RCC1 family protein